MCKKGIQTYVFILSFLRFSAFPVTEHLKVLCSFTITCSTLFFYRVVGLVTDTHDCLTCSKPSLRTPTCPACRVSPRCLLYEIIVGVIALAEVFCGGGASEEALNGDDINLAKIVKTSFDRSRKGRPEIVERSHLQIL